MPNLDELLADARAKHTRLDSVHAFNESLRKEIFETLHGTKAPKEAHSKIDELFELLKKHNVEVTQALQVPGPAGDLTAVEIEAHQPKPEAPPDPASNSVPADQINPKPKEDKPPEFGNSPTELPGTAADVNHPNPSDAPVAGFEAPITPGSASNTTEEQHGILPVTDAPPASSDPTTTEPATHEPPTESPTRRRRS